MASGGRLLALFLLVCLSGVCVATTGATDELLGDSRAAAVGPGSDHSAAADEAEEDDDGEDDSDGDGQFDFPSMLGSLGGGGMPGNLGGFAGSEALGGLGGLQGIGSIGNLPGFGAIPGLLGGGQEGGDLAELLNSVANQQVAGANQISVDFVQQIYKMLAKNSTMLEGLMNEFMQEPYLGVKEIPKPDFPDDLYVGATDIPDELDRNTTRPQPVSLEKIQQFLRIPENSVSPLDPSRDGACHALVLSGAGTKGAFQAGAIVGLAEQYKAHKRPLRWDVVSGVGFGGVQAAMSLPFKPGNALAL